MLIEGALRWSRYRQLAALDGSRVLQPAAAMRSVATAACRQIRVWIGHESAQQRSRMEPAQQGKHQDGDKAAHSAVVYMGAGA
jgi:hypothetical protein